MAKSAPPEPARKKRARHIKMSSALRESLLDPTAKAAPDASKFRAVLGLVAVAFFGSTDPLLLHFLQTTRGAATTASLPILFWKHAAMTVVGLLYGLLSGSREQKRANTRSGCRGLCCLTLAVVPLTLVNLCWTYSLMFTTASHCVALFVMSPPWACLLQWSLLGERPKTATMLASALALASAVGILLVSGTEDGVPADAAPTGAHSNDFWADLIAVLAGFFVACFQTACKWAEKTCPEAPMQLAPPLAACSVAVLSCALAAVGGVPSSELLGAGVDVLPFAVGIVLNSITETIYDLGSVWAAEFLSAPEIGLVLLLELPVGPWYVLLAYGEAPSRLELALGGLMLIALAADPLYRKLAGSD